MKLHSNYKILHFEIKFLELYYLQINKYEYLHGENHVGRHFYYRTHNINIVRIYNINFK